MPMVSSRNEGANTLTKSKPSQTSSVNTSLSRSDSNRSPAKLRPWSRKVTPKTLSSGSERNRHGRGPNEAWGEDVNSEVVSPIDSRQSTTDDSASIASRFTSADLIPAVWPGDGFSQNELSTLKPPPLLQRTVYNIHNPVGPRRYINHHLRPPNLSALAAAQFPSSAFSNQFPPLAALPPGSPPLRTLSMSGLYSPLRASSSSAETMLSTPESSQSTFFAAGSTIYQIRSKGVTPAPVIPADPVDQLDGSNPWGQQFHHDSPYDLGKKKGKAPERPMMSPSASDVRSRPRPYAAAVRPTAPSPLSQSTSAINIHSEGEGVKRKLSKRRSTPPTAMGQFSMRPPDTSVESHDSPALVVSNPSPNSGSATPAGTPTVTPPFPVAENNTLPNSLRSDSHLLGKLSKSRPLSLSTPSLPFSSQTQFPSPEKTPKRTSVLSRIAKRFSLNRKPEPFTVLNGKGRGQQSTVSLTTSGLDQPTGGPAISTEPVSNTGKPVVEPKKLPDLTKRVPPPSLENVLPEASSTSHVTTDAPLFNPSLDQSHSQSFAPQLPSLETHPSLGIFSSQFTTDPVARNSVSSVDGNDTWRLGQLRIANPDLHTGSETDLSGPEDTDTQLTPVPRVSTFRDGEHRMSVAQPPVSTSVEKVAGNSAMGSRVSVNTDTEVDPQISLRAEADSQVSEQMEAESRMSVHDEAYSRLSMSTIRPGINMRDTVHVSKDSRASVYSENGLSDYTNKAASLSRASFESKGTILPPLPPKDPKELIVLDLKMPAKPLLTSSAGPSEQTNRRPSPALPPLPPLSPSPVLPPLPALSPPPALQPPALQPLPTLSPLTSPPLPALPSLLVEEKALPVPDAQQDAESAVEPDPSTEQESSTHDSSSDAAPVSPPKPSRYQREAVTYIVDVPVAGSLFVRAAPDGVSVPPVEKPDFSVLSSKSKRPEVPEKTGAPFRTQPTTFTSIFTPLRVRRTSDSSPNESSSGHNHISQTSLSGRQRQGHLRTGSYSPEKPSPAVPPRAGSESPDKAGRLERRERDAGSNVRHHGRHPTNGRGLESDSGGTTTDQDLERRTSLARRGRGQRERVQSGRKETEQLVAKERESERERERERDRGREKEPEIERASGEKEWERERAKLREREREQERERERQKQREWEREREKQREKAREMEREKERARVKAREQEKEREREAERLREKERERERARERERQEREREKERVRERWERQERERQERERQDKERQERERRERERQDREHQERIRREKERQERERREKERQEKERQERERQERERQEKERQDKERQERERRERERQEREHQEKVRREKERQERERRERERQEQDNKEREKTRERDYPREKGRDPGRDDRVVEPERDKFQRSETAGHSQRRIEKYRLVPRQRTSSTSSDECDSGQNPSQKVNLLKVSVQGRDWEAAGNSQSHRTKESRDKEKYPSIRVNTVVNTTPVPRRRSMDVPREVHQPVDRPQRDSQDDREHSNLPPKPSGSRPYRLRALSFEQPSSRSSSPPPSPPYREDQEYISRRRQITGYSYPSTSAPITNLQPRPQPSHAPYLGPRPASGFPSSDSSPFKAREAWEHNRMWRGQSMAFDTRTGASTVPPAAAWNSYSQPAFPYEPGPPAPFYPQAPLAHHGSSYTSFAVQQTWPYSHYPPVPSVPPPPPSPPPPPTPIQPYALPSSSNPLPAPPRISSYNPRTPPRLSLQQRSAPSSETSH